MSHRRNQKVNSKHTHTQRPVVLLQQGKLLLEERGPSFSETPTTARGGHFSPHLQIHYFNSDLKFRMTTSSSQS